MENNSVPSMSFSQAIQAVFSEYATFSGRARRSEYWYWYLFYVLVLIGAMILDNMFGSTFDYLPYGWLCCLASLAAFLPSLSVLIRRLHDIGKSGWWWLIGCIPYVGGIVLLIWCCKDSQRGTNEYGESPKYSQQ